MNGKKNNNKKIAHCLNQTRPNTVHERATLRLSLMAQMQISKIQYTSTPFIRESTHAPIPQHDTGRSNVVLPPNTPYLIRVREVEN